MKKEKITHHSFIYLLNTILLIGGMLLMITLLGYFLDGTSGIIWAIIFGCIFILFSPHISPQIIFRMNRGRKLLFRDAPGLYNIVQKLADRANLPTIPQLYHIPGKLMNAFLVGSREDPAIGISEGLLQNLSIRHLTAILAHEISHIQNNDTRVMRLADTISRLTSLFALLGQFLLFINLPLLMIGAETISWEAILLLIFAPTLNNLLQLALSRTREFEADLGAVRLTGDPMALVLALEKLEFYQDSLLEKMFLPGYHAPTATLFRTHPKTEDRIKHLLSLSKEELLRGDFSVLLGDAKEKTNSIKLLQ